jgi:hypothetical protein
VVHLGRPLPPQDAARARLHPRARVQQRGERAPRLGPPLLQRQIQGTLRQLLQLNFDVIPGDGYVSLPMSSSMTFAQLCCSKAMTRSTSASARTGSASPSTSSSTRRVCSSSSPTSGATSARLSCRRSSTRSAYTDDTMDMVIENLTLSGRNLFPNLISMDTHNFLGFSPYKAIGD